ncbi:MAG: hypothetical protein MI741_15450 [Rhodospirillales bacterium]|nr:hypothetical protein [Rhodospirillales bacterium]
MSDAPTLSGLAVSAAGREPSIYGEAREVNARARMTQRNDSPAMQKALTRLDQALNTAEPLDRNVPRGFYLNILA